MKWDEDMTKWMGRPLKKQPASMRASRWISNRWEEAKTVFLMIVIAIGLSVIAGLVVALGSFVSVIILIMLVISACLWPFAIALAFLRSIALRLDAQAKG